MKKYADRWLLIAARVWEIFTEEDAFGNREAREPFGFLVLLITATITAVVIEVFYT